MGNLFVRPTADQIASGRDLSGKLAIVTGASSGIGFESARALAKRGVTVILACRDPITGEAAKNLILEQIGSRFAQKLMVMGLDLSSLQSVKDFVEQIRSMERPLHYVILNAAVLGVPYRLTKEGFEAHFGVNYLGHYYLSHRLLPILRQYPDEDVRIVAVCCSSARKTRLKLKSMAWGCRQNYSAYKAYDQSKLALRYMAEEMSLNLMETNVSVVGADPGATSTWIVKHLNPIVLSFMAFASIFMKTPPQGAATVVFACLDRRIPTKLRPFCTGCRLLKFNIGRCRNPELRHDLYQMTQDLIDEATFGSCQMQAFDAKIELWKTVGRMMGTLLHQKKGKMSKRHRQMQSTAVRYQKLD